jgi:hypothetical protein
MPSKKTKTLVTALCVLTLGILACEPVVAIGWREVFFIFLLMSFLFGPPLYRFLRRLENFHRNRQKKK